MLKTYSLEDQFDQSCASPLCLRTIITSALHAIIIALLQQNFKKNVSKVNGGKDFDEDMLDEIYNAIRFGFIRIFSPIIVSLSLLISQEYLVLKMGYTIGVGVDSATSTTPGIDIFYRDGLGQSFVHPKSLAGVLT